MLALLLVLAAAAPPATDESMAAVICLRDKAAAVAARPGPAESLAGVLLQECRAETDALRASFLRDHGEASAANIMATVTNTLRMVAGRALAQARAAR